jgi:hypothetical protein
MEAFMELADRLCEMIQQHRMIELRGRDDPEGQSRLAEPHAVYIGSNDRGFVDFFQRAGWSKSGKLPGWRRFALLDVVEVQPTGDSFTPRADYRPENRRWYRAFVCTTADTRQDDERTALPVSDPTDESATNP